MPDETPSAVIFDDSPPPDAITPHVVIGEPNESIEIRREVMTLHYQEDHRVEALISLRWLPMPTIRLSIPDLAIAAWFESGEPSGQLDDGTLLPDLVVTSKHMHMGPEGNSASVNAVVAGRVVSPGDRAARHALFLLPNYDAPMGRLIFYPGDGTPRATGRLVLAGGGWVITLDPVRGKRQVIEHLEANSGFGVTQVGRLERGDGSHFKAEEADEVLQALSWYVSFAAGHWTRPYLTTAFDENGGQIWQIWDHETSSPYRAQDTWIHSHHGSHFEGPFPGFMDLWIDETWRGVVKQAVHWHIESNARTNSIDGAIVLTQTAFELLASAILVDREAWLSQEEFDGLKAIPRIRLLFKWAGIPTGVPPQAGELVKLAMAKENNFCRLNGDPDAAAVMTWIRNKITHPTRKNLEALGRQPFEAKLEAWRLGLRNLDLCLLRLFGHNGSYCDRITRGRFPTADPVPWR